MPRGETQSGSAVGEISSRERAILLRLARSALERSFRGGALPSVEDPSPVLQRPRATFVSLRQRDGGELRGCRGECRPRLPLAESVMVTAIAAATDDPRFDPVTLDELADLRIEISALTQLAPIRPEAIVVGRHGLLLTKEGRSGLLLPQVPVAYGWGTIEYLRRLCAKADVPDDAWQAADTQLWSFETEVWEEP